MKDINLNELRDRAYQCAVNHGWHEKHYPNVHFKMLVLSEIGEAINADRENRRAKTTLYLFNQETMSYREEKHFVQLFYLYVKDTFEDELADVFIRLLDMAGLNHVDLGQFNDKEVNNAEEVLSIFIHTTEQLFVVAEMVLRGPDCYQALYILIAFAKLHKIDLLWFVEQKMKYNELRPYKHGKKY